MPQDPLKIESVPGTNPGTIIVRLVGPLTITNLFSFQEHLRSLTAELTVFDMTAVPYMDSAGLGSILNYYVASKKNGRKISLACVNERIGALIELTKVNTVLQIFPSIAAAEASAGL